ncbi:creatinine amidohydrolase [Alkalibacterium subtropicum]|uniref:Creatinine amidohydrolase n=1 Tax=Alkalibacterium subtropicum TaxID=753702 RepID=A0A1I1HSN1_9LACT|nr:creatininase family protein [Alkalibacterium subtropicum]SFC24453.1 creatinine amidohydrolase [Alkalibacterium subtropicum]
MHYGKLTYLEIAQKAKEDYSIIIPTGCTEQQGPHVTVDFDTWFAEELMMDVSGKALDKYNIKTLVLPAIPFGPTPEHKNFGSGYINIPQKLHEEIISAVLQSLSDQGFKKLFIWRGCGGHKVDRVIDKFNSQNEEAEVSTLQHPFYEAWCSCGDPKVAGGHADSFTTSVTLYRHPENVREDKIKNPHSDEPDWGDPDLDFSNYSKTGVIGDPTQASAELGKRLWDDVVDRVVELLKKDH